MAPLLLRVMLLQLLSLLPHALLPVLGAAAPKHLLLVVIDDLGFDDLVRLVLGSWGNTVRGAGRNKGEVKRAPCSYPRSQY